MSVLKPNATYEEVRADFSWPTASKMNMAIQVCDRHAEKRPSETALIVASSDGARRDYTWQEIRQLSNKLANLFLASDIQPGDRIGILLSQSVEAAIGHVAAWKIGAVSIPLFTLFGEEPLTYRLSDSGAKAIITESSQLEKVAAIRHRLPELSTVLLADGHGDDVTNVWSGMEKAKDRIDVVDTGPDDPSYIIYTSGTTGNPKGALMGHRSLLGHMPGVEFFHDFLPQPGDLMWTPADWAWIGGMMNCLMGAWFHGVPVLAYRAGKYDPEEALRLMAKYQVRNTFMPPTALKLMREVSDIQSYGADLRSIAVAGEPMGAELLEWGQSSFGLSFNEFYGQTECNLVVGNCQKIMKPKAGSMGRPIPGHNVAILDSNATPLPAGEIGQIGVKTPDPVMMLRYWNNSEATEKKFKNGWLLTGDEGQIDEDGYLWFVGRDDDVITSAGYRIGPGEIEDCVTRHPSVALAAAIGVPDPVRTEVIKVFVQLVDGTDGSNLLEEEIRGFVKSRLSPHEYPRLVEFVDALPMTTTGKIRRKELRDAERAKKSK